MQCSRCWLFQLFSFEYSLEQNLGSSDPSPQSSLLSQNCAAEMQLLFAHEYSLIEHFWLIPAFDEYFGCIDCLILCVVVTARHKYSITILIFLAIIFSHLISHKVAFLAVSRGCLISVLIIILLRTGCHNWTLFTLTHSCNSKSTLKNYLHFVTSLSWLSLLMNSRFLFTHSHVSNR